MVDNLSDDDYAIDYTVKSRKTPKVEKIEEPQAVPEIPGQK